MATPRSSLKKRLRQRFGISAPKVAIRTHVAWYWRALAIIGVLSISLALAAWIYDAGRQIAGHSGESARELQSLRTHVMELDAELTKLRSVAGSGESSLQIERSTQQQLSKQVKSLEIENAALKQDLAFFEGLMPSSALGEEGAVKIDHLRIDPEGSPDTYRYRMLVVHNGGRQMKELKGSLELVIKVQRAGKDAMITLPSETEPKPQHFRFEIKRFHRLEGVFSVPAGNVVKGVEARLLQDGSIRARQSVTL
jgi:hypothetical protein